jgi:nitronate monooxygenase
MTGTSLGRVRDSPLHTPLCDLLGIRHPLVLAPMAGGPGTPELAAAVTRAGGLGTLGVAGMTPERARQAVARALELAGPPIAVNVQLALPEPGTASPAAVHGVLDPFRRELGLPEGGSGGAWSDALPLELLAAGLEAGAAVASVALGDPGEAVALARGAGARLIAAASTVEEARRCADAGADAVVAQGAEAGGHRTTFAPDPVGPPLIGTFALVPQVVDAVDAPVLAAGGVMDGRGLAAALALGAQGVQMGTRFMLAEEANVAEPYRERLLAARDVDTFVTDAVTGRPARWVRNRLSEGLAGAGGHLGWGAQRAAMSDVGAAARQAGQAELMPMLSGQAAALAGEVKPAAEIVDEVVGQAAQGLRGLAGG